MATGVRANVRGDRDEGALVGIERDMDVRLAPAAEVRVDHGLADRQLALGLDVDVQEWVVMTDGSTIEATASASCTGAAWRRFIGCVVS